jgi:hypothetical protein
MRVRSVAVVVCAFIAMAVHVLQGPTASAGSDKDRAEDLAAIEKLFQQDIAATVSRDPVALTVCGPMTLFVSAEARRRSVRRPSERATYARRPTRTSEC